MSFAKATFAAEGSDQALDLNDPSFWEKVLGPKPAQRLLSDVTQGKLDHATPDAINAFLSGPTWVACGVVFVSQGFTFVLPFAVPPFVRFLEQSYGSWCKKCTHSAWRATSTMKPTPSPPSW